MEINAELVKKLREQTGAGMMDCKKFLAAATGDFDKAVELFRKEGQKVAAKKADRGTSEGLIDAYVHPGNKVGVLIKVSCETDFVARNQDFKDLVHDLAMHIAAFDPQYLSSVDVPEGAVASEICLLSQPFLKDDSKTVEQYIQEKITTIGENIKVGKFVRYSL